MSASPNSLHDPAARRHLRQALLRWYDASKRDLPWRLNHDPYRVWVAEIMLQQTRVAAVVDYYQRFLQLFPAVQELAGSPVDSVLAAWSGLGYYRRARFLHAAARRIVNELGGQFPQSADGWRELPGIGRYTAAAIASIAFGERIPVVDGNVERVLSRMVGENISGERSWSLAGALLSSTRPGDFNQALMELGATVCLPRNPRCLVCPVRPFCSTKGEDPATPPKDRYKREICYSLNLRDGTVLLARRPSKASLMPGMWELPEVVSNGGGACAFTLTHSITNTDYVVRVYPDVYPVTNGGRWLRFSRLSTLPLTGLTRKILRTAGVI